MSGCDPSYTDNPLNLGSAWWNNPAPGKCPTKTGIIALAQPYECVVKRRASAPG